MQQQQGAGIPPQLIWGIGLPLLAVDTLAAPYWAHVWAGIRTGQGPSKLQSPQAFDGFWRLGGGLLLLVLLGLWARVSEAGGVFGVLFLLILWAFFLVQHQEAVSTVLTRFSK